MLALTLATPTLQTWHCHLGHANYHTIFDMSKASVVDGMPIDLSSTPPKCEPCVLRKQAHMHVPSVHEGVKATKCLQRVHIDLCRLMPMTSRSSYRYSMNLIDDFSGYPWTIPLKLKSDAFLRLRAWELSVTTQCNEHVSIYNTDNGELKSHKMQNWCES